MKRGIIYLLLLLAFGCDKDEKPEDVVLELSLQQIEMKYTKDASLVIVNTLSEWKVADDAEWIHLSAYEGDGKMGFIIGADENSSFSRKAVVTIQAEDKIQKIAVVQSANPRKAISIGAETMLMVLVDSGTFSMGGRYTVGLSEFYISETEVTNAVWKLVMDTLPGQITENRELPVSNVSWNAITNQFLPLLSQKTGTAVKLPTEAQWEFAARGGKLSRNYLYSGSSSLDDVAWMYTNSGDRKHPVKRKLPNELGLYDMSGNLDEWCSDWYADQYGVTTGSPADTLRNPKGPTIGTEKVIKGGNYSYGMFAFDNPFFTPQSRVSMLPNGYQLAGDNITWVQVSQRVGFRLVISR